MWCYMDCVSRNLVSTFDHASHRSDVHTTSNTRKMYPNHSCAFINTCMRAYGVVLSDMYLCMLVVLRRPYGAVVTSNYKRLVVTLWHAVPPKCCDLCAAVRAGIK